MPVLWKRTTSVTRYIASAGFQAAFLAAIFLSTFICSKPNEFGTVCLLKSLSGLDCPGCGLTRSFIALSHGKVGQGFHYHWLGPPLYIFFVLLLTNRLCRVLNKTAIFQFVEREKSFQLWCVALVLVWMWRLA